jgi:hypothetical protein
VLATAVLLAIKKMPATADIQGIPRQATATHMPATVGVLATEGMLSIADIPGTLQTSKSSRAASTAEMFTQKGGQGL